MKLPIRNSAHFCQKHEGRYIQGIFLLLRRSFKGGKLRGKYHKPLHPRNGYLAWLQKGYMGTRGRGFGYSHLPLSGLSFATKNKNNNDDNEGERKRGAGNDTVHQRTFALLDIGIPHSCRVVPYQPDIYRTGKKNMTGKKAVEQENVRETRE